MIRESRSIYCSGRTLRLSSDILSCCSPSPPSPCGLSTHIEQHSSCSFLHYYGSYLRATAVFSYERPVLLSPFHKVSLSLPWPPLPTLLLTSLNIETNLQFTLSILQQSHCFLSITTVYKSARQIRRAMILTVKNKGKGDSHWLLASWLSAPSTSV